VEREVTPSSSSPEKVINRTCSTEGSLCPLCFSRNVAFARARAALPPPAGIRSAVQMHGLVVARIARMIIVFYPGSKALTASELPIPGVNRRLRRITSPLTLTAAR